MNDLVAFALKGCKVLGPTSWLVELAESLRNGDRLFVNGSVPGSSGRCSEAVVARVVGDDLVERWLLPLYTCRSSSDGGRH